MSTAQLINHFSILKRFSGSSILNTLAFAVFSTKVYFLCGLSMFLAFFHFLLRADVYEPQSILIFSKPCLLPVTCVNFLRLGLLPHWLNDTNTK